LVLSYRPLKSERVRLLQLHEGFDELKRNLVVELEKGAHYYDIPQIGQQFPIPRRRSNLKLDKHDMLEER